MATQCGVNFIAVKGPQLLSKYVGEAEKSVREVFKKARQASPCILVFDEIESLVPKRDTGDSSGVSQRVVSQFLSELSGLEELKGVVVIGTTNRLDLVDPALLRPGRFDFLLEIPKPDERIRYEIFKIHTREKPLAENVDLKILSKETEGLTGADIETICQKASLLAIREAVAHNPSKNLKISLKHFKEIVKEIRRGYGKSN